jgi:heme exporter protein B
MAAKDLRIELRSKVATNQVVPFAVVVLLLFGLALGPDPKRLTPAASGLFWIAVLFSTVLAVQRSFAVESSDDARDGLRLSGLDPAGIFLGKLAAVAVQLLVLEVVLALVASLLYQSPITEVGLLIAACVAATFGLAAVATLYGVLAAGTRVRETLLPMLFFPVAAPVLLAATKVWQAALAHAPSTGTSWLELLVVFAVAYVAIGTVSFGPLLEDG